MMSAQEILASVGSFSYHDLLLFEEKTVRKLFKKNDVLLRQGEICQSVYFILLGSFFQFQSNDITETIIDLHLPKEWMYNHPSLIEQKPSDTTIKAFEKSEVLELSLTNLHSLIAKSQSFLSLGRIFDQPNNRTYLFDRSLSPVEKYNYIKNAKPLIVQVFPVKMIASYLKIAPETLSRVRANQ
ncbi:Crp/Fnr family transcriptional regulator [Pedobacter sp. ISL-68]|uniref:Crp/Fnr family transcriptional regulator n=1 Tax=unclassified Pedobacter TaxID=2628915 RepID=UPI001BE715D7|nr:MULTISPECIES: cyclic nucleotide-binding domain-containing protein [unclassified Pedobacter]MBT2560025.1 Crp/Fnr family transcriptional regulator [Pedobacter sp. ISL-64]MBT2592329.1 Crp/Fnr family transcriptional regulator [Pedobacter sp. ISL-68]